MREHISFAGRDDREAARRERPFRRPLTHRGRHHQALPVDEHARAHGVRPGCISWPTPRLAGGRSPLIARATRHEDLTRPEFISEIEQVHREALKQNARRITVSASPSCSGKSRTSWMPSPPVNCAGLLRSLAARNQRSIPRVHTLLDRWRVRGPDGFDRPPVVPGEPRESVDARHVQAAQVSEVRLVCDRRPVNLLAAHKMRPSSSSTPARSISSGHLHPQLRPVRTTSGSLALAPCPARGAGEANIYWVRVVEMAGWRLACAN